MLKVSGGKSGFREGYLVMRGKWKKGFKRDIWEVLLWCSGLRIRLQGIPLVAEQKRVQLVTMRMQIWSLATLSGRGSGIAVRCGVGRRHGLDPTLLWLWCRSKAVVLIWLLAYELLYAGGTALKKKKKKKNVTSAARVTSEAQVQSLAQDSGLKY